MDSFHHLWNEFFDHFYGLAVAFVSLNLWFIVGCNTKDRKVRHLKAGSGRGKAKSKVSEKPVFKENPIQDVSKTKSSEGSNAKSDSSRAKVKKTSARPVASQRSINVDSTQSSARPNANQRPVNVESTKPSAHVNENPRSLDVTMPLSNAEPPIVSNQRPVSQMQSVNEKKAQDEQAIRLNVQPTVSEVPKQNAPEVNKYYIEDATQSSSWADLLSHIEQPTQESTLKTVEETENSKRSERSKIDQSQQQLPGGNVKSQLSRDEDKSRASSREVGHVKSNRSTTEEKTQSSTRSEKSISSKKLKKAKKKQKKRESEESKRQKKRQKEDRLLEIRRKLKKSPYNSAERAKSLDGATNPRVSSRNPPKKGEKMVDDAFLVLVSQSEVARKKAQQKSLRDTRGKSKKTNEERSSRRAKKTSSKANSSNNVSSSKKQKTTEDKISNRAKKTSSKGASLNSQSHVSSSKRAKSRKSRTTDD